MTESKLFLAYHPEYAPLDSKRGVTMGWRVVRRRQMVDVDEEEGEVGVGGLEMDGAEDVEVVVPEVSGEVKNVVVLPANVPLPVEEDELL